MAKWLMIEERRNENNKYRHRRNEESYDESNESWLIMTNRETQ